VATSGTVGTTVFNTAKLIEHAYGRCKIARQEIVGEKLEIARELLFLRLSTLANRNIPLWAIESFILPLYQGVFSVPTPQGTVNILDLNMRRSNRLTGTASSSSGTAGNAFDDDFDTICTTGADGWIQLQLDDGTRVPMFGFLPGASGDWSYTVQGSDDGVSFVTLYTATEEAVVDSAWVWFDVEGVEDFTYYRLQATDGTVLAIRELVFANTPNEINMALMNRTNYSNMPDKTFQSQPTQYWLDKQRVVPIITLWPAPNLQTRYWTLTGYLQRQIQDVGSLTQEVEVRQSDYMAIMARLAADIGLQDKEVDADWAQVLAVEADREWTSLLDGESDDAPATLLPNISPYTR
jgi:hypothetical protein